MHIWIVGWWAAKSNVHGIYIIAWLNVLLPVLHVRAQLFGVLLQSAVFMRL